MLEIKSRTEMKRICRKCKTLFLSVDVSPCPTCSKKNKELAVKREANKAVKEEKEAESDDNSSGD